MLTLPLVSGDRRTVKTTIGGQRYTFTTKFNSRTLQYTLDIQLGQTILVEGIPLVSGVDIFSIYPEIPIRRVYCINKLSPLEDITEGSLGTTSIIVIVEDSDLEV